MPIANCQGNAGEIIIRNMESQKMSILIVPPPKLIKCGGKTCVVWALPVMKNSSRNNTRGSADRTKRQKQPEQQRVLGNPGPGCSSTGIVIRGRICILITEQLQARALRGRIYVLQRSARSLLRGFRCHLDFHSLSPQENLPAALRKTRRDLCKRG